MAAPIDIGVSASTSSGVQSGDINNTGDLIIGGSGGASKTPTWLWLVLGGIAVLLFLGWLVKSK